jgi:hypothetical protein
MIILINANMFVVKLISIVSNAYGMQQIFGKYRFASSIASALAIIRDSQNKLLESTQHS